MVCSCTWCGMRNCCWLRSATWRSKAAWSAWTLATRPGKEGSDANPDGTAARGEGEVAAAAAAALAAATAHGVMNVLAGG